MDYTLIILTFTVMSLMMPSVFTIAWSKTEKAEHMPILYGGLGISLLTVLGALAKSESMVGLGLTFALIFFIYVVFFYSR